VRINSNSIHWPCFCVRAGFILPSSLSIVWGVVSTRNPNILTSKISLPEWVDDMQIGCIQRLPSKVSATVDALLNANCEDFNLKSSLSINQEWTDRKSRWIRYLFYFIFDLLKSTTLQTSLVKMTDFRAPHARVRILSTWSLRVEILGERCYFQIF
jgi:hypothetical protein